MLLPDNVMSSIRLGGLRLIFTKKPTRKDAPHEGQERADDQGMYTAACTAGKATDTIVSYRRVRYAKSRYLPLQHSTS